MSDQPQLSPTSTLPSAAQAAFEGALFLMQYGAITHRFGDRWVTDTLLGAPRDLALPVAITIDPQGIAVVSKQVFRIRGCALDITETALRRYYAFEPSTAFRLDRDTLTVRLSCLLPARWLKGMTLEGAERILDEVWRTYLAETDLIEAMVRALDAAALSLPLSR
jgi:hypothetical protein